MLSTYQVTIPELGTVRAATPPVVVLTSNRTRELHDALKRRCLYHWIDHPGLDREVAIVRTRAPQVSAALAEVLTGGTADHIEPVPAAKVLELEREGFMKLIRTEATLERIEHVLETGKPLRN